MVKVKEGSKTKEQLKDEKIFQKELIEFEDDYDRCRDLLIKIENHFVRKEPIFKTTKNEYYKEHLSELDFVGLLTDMKYPLTDLEKYITFQWMSKNEFGKAAFNDIRWSIANKVAQLTKNMRQNHEKQNKLVEANSQMKWVLVIFRLSGFTAFKMRSHTFKKVVKLSSSGEYLRNVIKYEIPDLPSKSVHLYTDSRSRCESMMQLNDTLEDMGLVGGTLEFPEEAVLHFDFSTEKVNNQPLIESVAFIKANNERFKTFRTLPNREGRVAAVESSLSSTNKADGAEG